MAHMLDYFGPSLKSPWTRLTAPELSQALRDDVVAGCGVEAGPRTIADLVAHRDAGIIALRRLTAQLSTAGTETVGTHPTSGTGSATAADTAEANGWATGIERSKRQSLSLPRALHHGSGTG